MYLINGFRVADDLSHATKNGCKIVFSFHEQAALSAFFNSENGFVSTQTLEAEVWEQRVVTHNSVRRLISDLRKKFSAKDNFKNLRGRGYQLDFEFLDIKHSQVPSLPRKQILFALFCLVICSLCAFLIHEYNRPDSSSNTQALAKQTVFSSDEYIVDYDKFGETYYVTTRGNNTSSIFKARNRQKTLIQHADYPGAFRGLEISNEGKTVIHVVEDGKCKINIYEKPIENLIDVIPCNRQNAYPSFDWIDENKFWITFNLNKSDSIKPFIYDLKTRRLETQDDVIGLAANSPFYIDGFIKAYRQGLFSLREDHLKQTKLIYLKDRQQKTIFEYAAIPYSIALSEDTLFFTGNHNELLQLRLEDNVLEQNLEPSLLLASQAVKIADPLFLDGNLHLTLGNASKEFITSYSQKYEFHLEDGVRDFTYTDDTLSIMGLTHFGYVIEQRKDGDVSKLKYIETDKSFRHLAFFENDLYLAGASGIWKVKDKGLIEVADLDVIDIVSNGNCMMAEASSGIYSFETSLKAFEKIASQGERVFPAQEGCMYVDNVSNTIRNEKREFIANPTMRKRIFEYKGTLHHWYSEGEVTHIVDLSTHVKVASLQSRALLKRVIGYKGDILYATQSGVNSSIIKLGL